MALFLEEILCRVPPRLILVFSDPADKVIFWVVLPDGVLWINFFSK